jgi:hypothetical protein
MGGQSKLFSASGPIVNEAERYKSGGIGYYLADFLHARVASEYLSLQQYAILAAYILHQAKEHVEGCGGTSHVAVLRHTGESGLVHDSRIDSWTKLLESIDARVGRLLIAAADLTNEEEISRELNSLKLALPYARRQANEEIEGNDKWWDAWNGPLASSLEQALSGESLRTPRDGFGFDITLSTPQKSEDQQ